MRNRVAHARSAPVSLGLVRFYSDAVGNLQGQLYFNNDRNGEQQGGRRANECRTTDVAPT